MVEGPQISDPDLPGVSAFFLYPFSRDLELGGISQARAGGLGKLALQVHPSPSGPCPWQPALSCSFSQGVLFGDFICNMYDYPENFKTKPQTRLFPSLET